MGSLNVGKQKTLIFLLGCLKISKINEVVTMYNYRNYLRFYLTKVLKSYELEIFKTDRRTFQHHGVVMTKKWRI